MAFDPVAATTLQTPVSNPLLTTLERRVEHVDIAELASGDLIVSWSERAVGSFDIYTQRFDADLLPLADPVRLAEAQGGVFGAFNGLVNPPAGAGQTTVTALADGGYTVFWSGSGVDGRRFDAAGNDITGSEQTFARAPGLLEPSTGGSGSNPCNDNDPSTACVYADVARTLDLLGTDLWASSAGTDTVFEYDVTALSDGGFLVGFAFDNGSGTDSDLALLRYGATPGVLPEAVLWPTVPNLTLFNPVLDSGIEDAGHQTGIALAGLAGGGFVMVWRHGDSDTPGTASEIRAQIYDADSAPVGSMITVASAAHGLQEPDVVMQADGSFVVAWNSLDYSATDGNFADIHSAVFEADGTLRDAPALVNPITFGNQTSVRLEAMGDGHLALWDSSAGNHGFVINGRAFAPDGTPIDSTFLGGSFEALSSGSLDYAEPALAVTGADSFVLAATGYQITSRGGYFSSDSALQGFTVPAPGADIILSGRITDSLGGALGDVPLLLTRAGGTPEQIFAGGGAFGANLVAGQAFSLDGHPDRVLATAEDRITAADALDVLRIAVGLDPLGGAADARDLIAADVNRSGIVTAADALEVLRFAVGLQSDTDVGQMVLFEAGADLGPQSRDDVDYLAGYDNPDPQTDLDVQLQGILLGDMLL